MTARGSSGGPGHLFHLSRVWGSRHGGSFYSKRLVEELSNRGWRVTLLAERFEDREEAVEGISAGLSGGGPSMRPPTAKAGMPGNPGEQRIQLRAFFHKEMSLWPQRVLEVWRMVRKVGGTPGALVTVQGDLPRLSYLLLQLRVPLVFIRQDGILTCPGNNRFLPRSRKVCAQPLGLSCLKTHRREGCLGSLSPRRRIGRLVFRVRDALLLGWLRHFVGSSGYVVCAHRRSGLVLYPPRLSGEGFLPVERDLHRLAFCGRLEAVKGAEEAVRILSLLPQEFYLEILGDGPERGRLDKVVQDLQLEKRVRFRGWVDPQTRDTWLASSGVLLMPGLWDEAFGMAGIEALTQGTPVVAYDVGGVSEWCRSEAGVLVGCGDIERAAQAIRQMTSDPVGWAARSGAARRFVEREFPAGRFGRELEGVLANL